MQVDVPMRAVPLVAGDIGFGHLKILPLAAWGVAAATALAVVVVAGRTELGAQRAQAALMAMFSPPPSPDQHADQQLSSQMIAWSQGVEKQFRRQSDIIETLTEQRDRLADKVAAMDHQLGELSAALGRATARMDSETRLAQIAAAATAAAAKSPGPSPKADLKTGLPDVALPSTAPPALSASATTGALPGQIASLPQAMAGQPNLLPPGQIYPPAAATMPNLPNFSATAEPVTTTALPPPMSLVPEVATTSALPMTRPFPVAAHQAAASTATARQNVGHMAASHGGLPMFQNNPLMTAGILDTPADSAAISPEFAIDLGGAATIDALRARWNQMKTTQSPLLDNLTPLITLKDGGKSGQEMHLVAGPLGSAAATSRLCAVLSGAGVHCQSTFYEGQRLAMR